MATAGGGGGGAAAFDMMAEGDGTADADAAFMAEEDPDDAGRQEPGVFGPLRATPSRSSLLRTISAAAGLTRSTSSSAGGMGVQEWNNNAAASGADQASRRGAAAGRAGSNTPFKGTGTAGRQGSGGLLAATAAAAVEREEQINFHLPHFFVMFAYNICPLIGLPVGICLESLPMVRQCQLLPDNPGAFFNTWVPFLFSYLSVIFALLAPVDGPLPRRDCLALAVVGFSTWGMRIVLIAIRYSYMSVATFRRFRAGLMSVEEFNSSLLGSAMNPTPDQAERELYVAAALRDIDLDSTLFIVSPDSQEIMRTEYLANGLTMDCVDRVVSMKSFLKGMVLDHRDDGLSRRSWALALTQTTIFAVVFGTTVGPILDNSVFPMLALLCASVTTTYMTAVMYALLSVGFADFRRRASMIARIDSLIAVRPNLVQSDQDIPKIEASEPLLDLTWITNASSWLNVRQVAKTFGAHVLARIQVVYTVWIVSLLLLGLFTFLNVERLIAAPVYCAMALTVLFTVYASGRIVLDGARANDATATAVLHLRQAVTSLGLRYAYTRVPAVLVREGIEDVDFNAIASQAEHLRMAEMALINVIEALQLEDRKYPITFLGIAASQTLLTSLGTLAVSGIVAGLRSGIPALIDYISQAQSNSAPPA